MGRPLLVALTLLALSSAACTGARARCARPSARCRLAPATGAAAAAAAATAAARTRPPAWDSGRLGALAFLLRRHDRDGDGAVYPWEHDRGAEAFARLDRNGDGRVDREDFAAPDPVAVQATEHVLWTILLPDEDAEAITLDDVASATERLAPEPHPAGARRSARAPLRIRSVMNVCRSAWKAPARA